MRSRRHSGQGATDALPGFPVGDAVSHSEAFLTLGYRRTHPARRRERREEPQDKWYGLDSVVEKVQERARPQERHQAVAKGLPRPFA